MDSQQELENCIYEYNVKILNKFISLHPEKVFFGFACLCEGGNIGFSLSLGYEDPSDPFPKYRQKPGQTEQDMHDYPENWRYECFNYQIETKEDRAILDNAIHTWYEEHKGKLKHWELHERFVYIATKAIIRIEESELLHHSSFEKNPICFLIDYDDSLEAAKERYEKMKNNIDVGGWAKGMYGVKE